jgi:DNA polymerase I-like protein with 3'-5' exonuclease and polymerase domains
MNVEGLPWFFTEGSQKVYGDPSSSYVVLDFEASRWSGEGQAIYPDCYLVLACWQVVRPGQPIEYKHKFGNEYEMQELVKDIKSVDFIVAHNIKYEYQWLKRIGMEIRDILGYCTMLGQWVLDGNQAKPRSLAGLAQRYGLKKKIDLIAKLWDAGLETDEIPDEWLKEYCDLDVELARQIFVKQIPQLQRRRQMHLAYVRNLTAACLADIEGQGMQLDKERVYAEYDRVSRELEETGAILGRITGGINLASAKQLSGFLFGVLNFETPKDQRGKEIKTPGGVVSVNAAALQRLKATTEEQKVFLAAYRRYNKLDSLLTKNLEFFKGVCDEKDGVFYATLNQNVVKSHRLSSSGRPIKFRGAKKARGAQFQNLPREYKKLFWSGDDDYFLGEADGAQLEFRVAADMGRDETAIYEIENDVDIHANTAKVFVEDGTQEEFIGLSLKEARQPAKPQTFKPLYGGTGNTPAEKKYCEFF